VIRYGSIAVPIAMVALAAAVDQIWYGGKLPASLFVTLLFFFVAGMATMVVGFRLNLSASKRRMRERTRQVFEPRTIRLTDEGIEQSLPELRSLHLWRGIDRVEWASDLILIWAGNLLASGVPVRAFRSQADAQDFLEACRRTPSIRHLPVPVRCTEHVGLGRQHHIVESLRKHRGGEKGNGAKRFLAGVGEVVAQRRWQHEDTSRPHLVGGAVLEMEFAVAGNDVLRLLGRIGVPAKPAARFDLVDDGRRCRRAVTAIHRKGAGPAHRGIVFAPHLRARKLVRGNDGNHGPLLLSVFDSQA
jgi:hypothetical protein